VGHGTDSDKRTNAFVEKKKKERFVKGGRPKGVIAKSASFRKEIKRKGQAHLGKKVKNICRRLWVGDSQTTTGEGGPRSMGGKPSDKMRL